MYKYVITGKVLPERVDFHLSTRAIIIHVPDFNFEVGLKLSIAKSQILAQIGSEKEIQDYETLRNVVVDVIRLHTDIDGYIKGHGYDVEITSLVGEDNVPHIVYGIGIAELEKDLGKRPIKDIDDIVSKFGRPEYNFLRMALLDLQLSIKYPKDTGVFCYRAIESVMQYFNDGPNTSESRKEAWRQLESKLNVSESWIDFVRNFALNPRHGLPQSITGNERVSIMKHTWEIIDRFIVYLENKEGLSQNVYPELK